MKTIILAAGRSRRMQPIEDKNFLNFLGKPLIIRQIETMKEAGLNEFVLVGGAHNQERLKEACTKFEIGAEIVEQKDLGMGMCGAVLAAADLIGNEAVLVVSSNDTVDVSAYRTILDAADFDGAMLGKKVYEYFPGGYLETEGGSIKSIVEKPGEGNEPSDLVNLVVHYHKDGAKLVDYLSKAKSSDDDLYETALQNMIDDGMKYQAVPYDGYWQPIKYPWHVRNVFKYYFEKANKKIDESAQISEHAIIKGDVIIGKNVRIFEGAIINGPCYIGDYSIVANNALVRDSHIGANCVIGFSSEVARSFLGNDVWTHSNYIGDSIIGNNVSFGAGAVTGNFRLDEKNVLIDCNGERVDSGTNKLGLICGSHVRAGVNTSFMPGVKVGSNSFVGAGIVVAEDIKTGSFVRGDWKLNISDNKIDVENINRDEIKNNIGK